MFTLNVVKGVISWSVQSSEKSNWGIVSYLSLFLELLKKYAFFRSFLDFWHLFKINLQNIVCLNKIRLIILIFYLLLIFIKGLHKKTWNSALFTLLLLKELPSVHSWEKSQTLLVLNSEGSPLKVLFNQSILIQKKSMKLFWVMFFQLVWVKLQQDKLQSMQVLELKPHAPQLTKSVLQVWRV